MTFLDKRWSSSLAKCPLAPESHINFMLSMGLAYLRVQIVQLKNRPGTTRVCKKFGLQHVASIAATEVATDKGRLHNFFMTVSPCHLTT